MNSKLFSIIVGFLVLLSSTGYSSNGTKYGSVVLIDPLQSEENAPCCLGWLCSFWKKKQNKAPIKVSDKQKDIILYMMTHRWGGTQYTPLLVSNDSSFTSVFAEMKNRKEDLLWLSEDRFDFNITSDRYLSKTILSWLHKDPMLKIQEKPIAPHSIIEIPEIYLN